ncbi:peptide ABC transporter substrate-binding protein [Bifidobacterium platyrrhinorum]|uniref:ABC transporter substrate-binding protein n=1 Tax=Bifidobacterium platyrrhinorum TaxID=2661628 RepID=A0A6L9SXE7_9BIFI|nr:ABC transporter substrate-binding protein [Bifidobacterium platyrrhinorum]NEG55811.1 ABC transporter substrate-binding protein [Bifidobacterium platyrrhinorum]
MKRTIRTVVAAIAAATMLAGCGATSQADKIAADDNIISFGIGEPQNPLVPGDTNEGNGALVLNRVLFTGLVATKADGGIVNENAEKIEPNADNTQYTVTLRKGLEFSDGTPITAESYVKAWSYTANVKNAQKNAGYLAYIKGYEDLQKDGLKGDEQLSGLSVKDDTHFTITLNEASAVFPTVLTFMAYDPLPESFYKDPKAFGQNPVGNGPYKFKSWKHDSQIEVVPNTYYTGYYKPKNNGITYRMYTDTNAQYADVQSGNLDITSAIPASALKHLLNDKTVKAYSEPGPVRVALGIPEDLKHFSGKEGVLRRKAISLAINRKAITEKIMNGLASPATDFASPVFKPYSGSLKGSDVLRHDAAEAKKLWEQANEISPWDGDFTITYNADGTYKETYDAIVNQLKNTLGIDAKTDPIPTQKEYITNAYAGKITSAYHDIWGPDYPSVEDYLTPIYASGAIGGRNYGKYDNAEFDGLLAKASAAASTDEADKLYVQAEEILLEDLPSIPIYNTNATSATVKGLKGVSFNWDSSPTFWSISKQ